MANCRFPDLQAKTEQFVAVDIFAAVVNYATTDKYGLAAYVKNTSYDLLIAVTDSNSATSKRDAINALKEADKLKQRLLVLIGTADKRNYQSHKRTAYLQRQLRDIGSLIGGSLKSLDAPAPTLSTDTTDKDGNPATCEWKGLATRGELPWPEIPEMEPASQPQQRPNRRHNSKKSKKSKKQKSSPGKTRPVTDPSRFSAGKLDIDEPQ